MRANQVKDILVPIDKFPHIEREASMRDAFAVLQRQHQTAGWRIRHLLVFDARSTLVGVLGIRDLLRSLMPDYLRATSARHVAGPVPDDVSLSILWQDSFPEQCRLAGEARVEKYMTPVRETVKTDDPLTRAAYLMVIHGHDMLPVLEGDRVAGVVRIVDVFNQAAGEVLHD